MLRLIAFAGLVAGVCGGHEECLDAQCADVEVSSLMQMSRRPANAASWPSCTKWITDASMCLNASAKALATQLSNVTLWENGSDQGFTGRYVEDGLCDMYDEGNSVSVAVSGHGFSYALPYTQQCDGTWTDSGHGDVEYFTCRVDVNGTLNSLQNHSSTVWFAGFRSKSGAIEGLAIRGELGADGYGRGKTGRTSAPVHSRYGYYSQTLETKDPSVNHLVVVESDRWVNTPYPTGGNSSVSGPEGLWTEMDIYVPGSGGRPVKSLLYVAWGGSSNVTGCPKNSAVDYSPANFQTALESIMVQC